MSDQNAYSVPSMGAEGGFEEFEGAAPIRITGFLSLLLGLFSVLCIAGRPALMLPILAIIFGLIAVRPYGDRKPVGRTAALIGILLALAFGSCGVGIPYFKTKTLGKQAEVFSLQYIKICQQNEAEIAMQLGQEHFNRLPLTVRLENHYAAEEAVEGSENTVMQFKDSGVFNIILDRGSDSEWEIAEATRVYHRYGFDKADTYWRVVGDTTSKPIVITLSYRIDSKTGDGHWRIDSAHLKTARIVAEKAT